MRYRLFVLFVLMTMIGCKQSNDTVTQVTDPPLSVSNVRDSILYTFAIPKSTFGIHDTLSATLILYNQSSSTDTLVLRSAGVFYSGSWSLKNENGRTITYGPQVIPQNVARVPLGSHQSLGGLVIDQVIADTSGASVVPGSYILQESFSSLTFTLNISLQ